MRRRPRAASDVASGGGSNRGAELQRAAIIDAAAQAFSLSGFAATKIDVVAEVLGSTKGLIYYHFKSKSDLFFAIHHDAMRLDVDTIEPLVALGLPPDQKLFEMLQAHAMFVIDRNAVHRVVVQGVELHLAGATTPSQRNMVKKIIALRDQYQDFFLSVVKAGQADGCLHAEDPSLAVKAILGAINWMTMWYKPDPQQTDDTRRELARKMTAVAIGGILARSARSIGNKQETAMRPS